MKSRRWLSTVLSVILLFTQLAMPLQRAMASPMPAAPATEPLETDANAPPTENDGAAPVRLARVAGPNRAPPRGSIAGPQGEPIPIGTGYSNYGQQQRDTDNPQAHPGHAFAGSVNVLNGNLFLTVGDIFLPGRGLSLQLARSYNSLAAANGLEGAFGVGWTHSYETRVISETAGATLTVVGADGARHEYTQTGPCPDGSGDLCYQAPPGFYRELRDMVGGNYLLTHKNGTRQVFDDQGRLIEIIDRHGNEIQLRYQDGGACPVPGPPNSLCEVLDPTGTRSLVFTYHEMPGPPRILSVSEAFEGVITATRAVAYEYSPDGDLVDVAYPEEPFGTPNYAYDPDHRMISYDDPRQPAGARTVQDIGYDDLDRVVTTTFYVDSFFDVFFEIDYAPPPADPDDGFLSEPGQVPVGAVEITDGEGQLSRVEYDANGNITYEGDWFPDYGWWWGKWWWWHPTEVWLLSKKVDANLNETAYDYDPWGNTAAVTNAYGAVQRFEWEPPAYVAPGVAYGNVLTATNSADVVTTYEYDYAGNSVIETRARGTPAESQTIYQSDPYGQLVMEQDLPLGRPTMYGYDELGNMTVVTDALGTPTRYVYDDFGRPEVSVDGLGNTTSYEYDAADRLTAVTDALGGTTSYVYSADGRDNLVELGNANGVTTTYTYDALDRLVAQVDSLGASTAYDYDNANRLVLRTDAEDRTTRYTYDAKSRMRTAASYEAGAPSPYQTNTYEYDGAGNLVRMANDDVRLAYAYDALDQRTQVEMWTPTWGVTRTLTLGRDPVTGNLIDVAGPAGYSLGYEYDPLNRLSAVTDPEGRITRYTYDPGGRLDLVQSADAVTTTHQYDPLNRLETLMVDTVEGDSFSYGHKYDPLGNLTAENDLGDGYAYEYDAVGRVITATGLAEGTLDYEYDPVGNRISASSTEVGAATTYNYDDANRLLQAGDASLGYDAMGARTSLQRTTVMAQAGGGSLPSGSGAGGPVVPAAAASNVAYAYDNDMRLLQVVEEADTTQFLYDPLGNLIGVVEADGTTRYYLRDGDDVYAELDATGAVVAYYTLGAQGVISMWRNGVPYLLLYDGQGRVRQVMDLLTQQIVHRYGRDLLALGVGLVDFYNPIRARGAWWFPTVGLVYYGGGVFWDPVYGVFLAKAWPWLYWPFGPFHPWRPIFRFWPWPWPWPRPWGWAWPRPWPFLWPWPGAWVRPWLIWPVWPWAFRFWWPWWYWRAWWGWMWWGRWWCWHPWWWWTKWWWWPWWHPWWWWPYWWWPWWWWTPCWWWPRSWWWWIWWPPGWWWWGPGWFWWCWWWWWPWPWWWWPWWRPWPIGPPPDYGDAPDPPYPSLRRSNGAAHGIWWYEWLGASRDGEWDSRQVNRDLYDDGVDADPLAGTLTYTPTVRYPGPGVRYSTAARLHVHGWIDWNSDGDWADPGEFIANWSGYPGDGLWPLGQNSFSVSQPFSVPPTVFGAANIRTLWLRFRLDYARNWERPTGWTQFGEVEDHPLTVARVITPTWSAGTVLVDAVPVVTYPISVTGVTVGITPTVVITPVWTTVSRLAPVQTGNRLEIQHEPFTVDEVYTVTLSSGATVDGGYVAGSAFSFTATDEVTVFLPIVVK